VKIARTLYPGQPGTKKLVEKYGDRLICARYRYDSKRKKRTTTVELVESENAWVENKHKRPRNKIVRIRIAWGEARLGRLLKAAGGKWNRSQKVWELPYGEVLDLGLEHRLVGEEP